MRFKTYEEAADYVWELSKEGIHSGICYQRHPDGDFTVEIMEEKTVESMTKKGEYKLWWLNEGRKEVIIDFPGVTRWIFKYDNRGIKHEINDWVNSTFGNPEAMLLMLEAR